jgi:fatty acid desaturase
MPEEELETQDLKERLEEAEEKLEEERREIARERSPSWTLSLSLSTAIIAVFAAIASLQSGAHANAAILSKNEAVLSQARASDQWAYYQAKGIKQAIYASQADGLSESRPDEAKKMRVEAEHYKAEQAEVEKQARELEAAVREAGKAADESLERHHQFAISVTVFQVAIALAAIAALTRRKPLWFVSLAVGVAGLVFFVRGFGGM